MPLATEVLQEAKKQIAFWKTATVVLAFVLLDVLAFEVITKIIIK